MKRAFLIFLLSALLLPESDRQSINLRDLIPEGQGGRAGRILQ